MSSLSALFRFLYCASHVFVDALIFFCLTFRSASALAAENLFLRKQLVLYVERNKKPRRATDPIRFTLAYLSRYFEWRDALTVVKPDTLIRWHGWLGVMNSAFVSHVDSGRLVAFLKDKGELTSAEHEHGDGLPKEGLAKKRILQNRVSTNKS